MAIFGNEQVYKGGGRFEEIPVAPLRRKQFTPLDAEQKEQRNLVNSMGMFDIFRDRGNFRESVDPRFDYAKKAEELSRQIEMIRAQAAAQRGQNSSINLANSNVNIPMGNLPPGRFGNFLRAIKGQESGGSYGAVNPDSGALGAYQIMPSNLAGTGRGWDYEALGRDVSTQAFLANPRIQERIARAKLREYFRKYGAAGAASAWYSGDPNKIHDRNAQGRYPSIYEYVQAILRRMGRA